MGCLYFAITYWQNKRNHNLLVLYGNVDIRQVDLGFRVRGRLEKMVFEEGDQVKTGDLVAVLDKAPYLADLATAQGQLAQAEANYAKLRHGNRYQEIEEARATVNERQAALDIAEITFKRTSQQFKAGSSSQQDYDNALAQQTEAAASLKNAQEALSLEVEGFRIEDIDAGRAAVETAKGQLETAKVNLQDTEIHAPSDGIVLTRVREPGAIVAPQSIVYTITLHKPVWIRAYVSETNLGRLKPGFEVLVFNDAHPDKPFKGQIGFISPQAEFTPKTVETTELRTDLVYRLRILADDPEGQLRQGMPVTIKIKIPEQKAQ
ncbi:MAG: secretion protein HlyD [Alphaproteobacteria bacterium 41-28]|nr:MAG: secretion protein HlyD [Alphaproteobacteria bacterium 41-28]